LVLDFLTRGEAYSYGPLRSQRADLYLPLGAGPHPVMVTIHGGAWHKRYGRSLMRGLAGDLVRRGWAVWNIEYRRLGETGGGWPATFEDVAAAIDHLRRLDAPLDLDGVSFVGHSAGGHLALWAAARGDLAGGAPGADPEILPRRVVGQAAVCDLAGGHRYWGGGALEELMGGSPEEVPERYAIADPSLLPPLAVPVLLVHGTVDRTISIKPARRYVERARMAGASAELIEIEGPAGSHRSHVDPRSQAWTAVTRWLGQPTGL
jgi:acetyl esterase/lipase